MQTFKTEGIIKATLTKYKLQSGYFWTIQDEKNACASCLICNHYKYNHDNIRKNAGLYVHICLVKAPEFIDVSEQLKVGLNTSCNESFLRRAVG